MLQICYLFLIYISPTLFKDKKETKEESRFIINILIYKFRSQLLNVPKGIVKTLKI